MKRFSILILLGIQIFLSCSTDTDPVSIDSGNISITVNSMNESDVDSSGIIEKDENISNDSGNPWGEFIKSAENRCDKNPGGFEIISVSIELDENGSQNLSSLDEIITGSATVFFANTQHSDINATRVNVASVSAVSGTGPIELGDLASRADMSILLDRLLGGDFHVGLQAETSISDTSSFSMDVQIVFNVRAFCD
jgi:hypothetical protein